MPPTRPPYPQEFKEDAVRLMHSSATGFGLSFSLSIDLALAQAALKARARGYVHTSMRPRQIVRAFEVASQGEIVAPGKLLEYLLVNEELADLEVISAHQREILQLVDEGLTNAQIARRLFLTESTVKQHLRGACKTLGVSNLTEAPRLLRNSG